MGAVDVTVRLRGWVAAAIEDACMGEEFWYDTDWQIMQTGQTRAMVYNVVVMMRNPLLGQGPLIMPFQVPITAVREDAVRMGVHHAMGELRKLHKQVLDNPQPVAKTSPS
jgi:hypothetical protein